MQTRDKLIHAHTYIYKYAHNQNSASTSVINQMEEHHKVGKKKME